MELFKLFGTIAVENTEAVESLEETSKKGQETESKLSKFFSGIGKGAAVVGKAVGTGMVAAGAAMSALTVQAMNLGGELEQNMGGSEAVFGKYAGKMQETAKNAFSNMGLSASDFLATSNKMGALFQGAGFDIEKSSDMAAEAMQRAADVASIMGLDTSAAMEAVAGMAKGNFTMMDNLGVAINDTTIQMYAFDKGIDKATKDMTTQEKVGLAMELFMERSAYAAGNYAKENETLAGSLGTAKSALTNFLDGSGSVEQLMVSFSNASNVIVKNIEELAPRLISGITSIVNQIIPILVPLLNQLLPVIIEGAVSLINGLVEAMPSVVSAITEALPALIEGVTKIMNALVDALPDMIMLIINALPTLLPALLDGIMSMIVTLAQNIEQIITPLIEVMPQIVATIIQSLMDCVPDLVITGGYLLLGILEGIKAFVTNIPAYIGQVFNAFVNGFCKMFEIHSPSRVMMRIGVFIMQGLFNGIKSLLGNIVGIWNTLKEKTNNVFNSIKKLVLNVWENIKKGVSNTLKAIQTLISKVWNTIRSTTSTVWNAVKTITTNAWAKVKDTISKVLSGIKDKVSTIFNAVKTKISDVLENVKGTVESKLSSVKEKFTSKFNLVKETVKNAIDAVKTKISDVLESVKTTVETKLSSVKEKFKAKFDLVKSSVKNAIDNVKKTISTGLSNARESVSKILGDIKDKFKSIFDNAKKIVSEAIEKIKNTMKFEWSLPKLKLPHIGISGKFSLNPPSVPKFSIEWYKKAMDNPMIMNSPTIFGYNAATGQLMGGGEAGSEVVSGTNTLMNMIQNAVSSQNGELTEILIKILNAIVSLDKNMSGNMRVALDGTAFEVNRREFARLVKAVN